MHHVSHMSFAASTLFLKGDGIVFLPLPIPDAAPVIMAVLDDSFSHVDDIMFSSSGAMHSTHRMHAGRR